MAIFRLFEEPVFPDPEQADPDGLLAIGGDLSVTRILTAYANGIFPWYADDSPILWWSTDPRLILPPSELHVPKSLRRTLNRQCFTFTLDRDFRAVINACAESRRPDQEGTWLVPEMIEAYTLLHDMGYAHSVEAWCEGQLAGGLYGISLGRAFFGESMFFRVSDASKAAFVTLTRQLARWDFHLVDCQQTTDHLLRFGAREVARFRFREMLEVALEYPTREGRWRFDKDLSCGCPIT